MAQAIGIDLGTTYSCVGIFKNGSVEIIPNKDGYRTTPSYVAFTENDGIICGLSAKNQCQLNIKNTIYDAKRLIGREYNDPVVQSDMKHYSYDIVNEQNKPYIKININNEEKTYPPEFISSQLLRYLKESAEQYLGTHVKDVVITVPAYFNDTQRQATKDAGLLAGLNVIRIINEPTASAIAYGLNKQDINKKVIVFDFGGGTYDISVLELNEGIFEVKSTNGNTHLGGEDIDNILVDYCVNMIKNKLHIDISKKPKNERNKIKRRLKTYCERVKITLSASKNTTIEIDSLVDGKDFVCEISRAKFEELCNNLFLQLFPPLDNALRDANLSKTDIEEIILIGGSSRIPKVQDMLSNYFGGKKLCKEINPDEAVAYGATIQCAILKNIDDEKLSQILLLDVTPLTIGVETMGTTMQEIIPRNSTIPIKKKLTFSTASDNQECAKIKIFEGERPLTRDNHFLGEFELCGIPKMKRGQPQIEITCDIDANGILTVTAHEKSSNLKQDLTINKQGSQLSKSEIDRMKEEAEKYKEEDDKIKEKLESKHKFDTLIYSAKNILDDDTLKNKISEEDKELINKITNEPKIFNMLNNHNEFSKDDYENEEKRISEIIQPIIMKLYSNNDDNTTTAQNSKSGPKIEEID